MSNKTPYEIRLEVLQMAKSHFDQTYTAQLEFAKEAFSKLQLASHISAQQFKDMIEAKIPVPYSMEDLVKKANDMYSFITKKD